MASVLVIPLGKSGRHVHLLDDVPPAHASVIGAEGNLAFLRRVRNDALLGAAEIVVEQILEPHSGDKEEVPAVFAAPLDVFWGALAGGAAVLLVGILRGSERLIELHQQIFELEVRRGLKRIVVAHER